MTSDPESGSSPSPHKIRIPSIEESGTENSTILRDSAVIIDDSSTQTPRLMIKKRVKGTYERSSNTQVPHRSGETMFIVGAVVIMFGVMAVGEGLLKNVIGIASIFVVGAVLSLIGVFFLLSSNRDREKSLESLDNQGSQGSEDEAPQFISSSYEEITMTPIDQEALVRCKYCETLNPDHADKCKNCGAPL